MLAINPSLDNLTADCDIIAAGHTSAPGHRCCAAESFIAGRHALAARTGTLDGSAAAAAALDPAAHAANSAAPAATTAARYAWPGSLLRNLWFLNADKHLLCNLLSNSGPDEAGRSPPSMHLEQISYLKSSDSAA